MAAKKKMAPKAKMAPMKAPMMGGMAAPMGGSPMQQPQPFAKGGKFKAGSKGKKK